MFSLLNLPVKNIFEESLKISLFSNVMDFIALILHVAISLGNKATYFAYLLFFFVRRVIHTLFLNH